MSDQFREAIVSLRNAYQKEAQSQAAGVGIRPINQESKVRADTVSVVLAKYDRYFQQKSQHVKEAQ